jgi:hypothetical protein
MIRLIESRVPKCLAVGKMNAAQLAQSLRCIMGRIPRPMGFFAMPSEAQAGGDDCAVCSNEGMIVSFGSYGDCDSVFRALFFMLTAEHVEMICDALELCGEQADRLSADHGKGRDPDGRSTLKDTFKPGIGPCGAGLAGGVFQPWRIPGDREACGESQS